MGCGPKRRTVWYERSVRNPSTGILSRGRLVTAERCKTDAPIYLASSSPRPHIRIQQCLHYPSCVHPLDPASTRNGVGKPQAERVLTEALGHQAVGLVAPGSGRSLLHLQDVELGTGRPDAILVAISLGGLHARRSKGLRLPSLAHAQFLNAIYTGRQSSYSAGHAASLTRTLRSLGWVTDHERVRVVPRLVSRSLVVEAKMTDWRHGVGQLLKARWASHCAALLMPHETQHRVPRTTLEHNGLGLLVANQGNVIWGAEAPTLDLSWIADLWLTELAIRAVAHDTV